MIVFYLDACIRIAHVFVFLFLQLHMILFTCTSNFTTAHGALLLITEYAQDCCDVQYSYISH